MSLVMLGEVVADKREKPGLAPTVHSLDTSRGVLSRCTVQSKTLDTNPYAVVCRRRSRRHARRTFLSHRSSSKVIWGY